jgi:hypothetical protein
MLCVRSGALRDAALIDGWLAGRGAAMIPDDRMSYDDASAAIDAENNGDLATWASY